MKSMSSIFLILFLVCASVWAQDESEAKSLTDQQLDEISTSLDAEDWPKAYDLSKKALGALGAEGDPVDIGAMRYINLFAASGMVTSGKMEFEEIGKLAKSLEGAVLYFPSREIRDDCPGFNFICFSEKDGKTAMVTASNNTATSILAFEYLTFKNPVDFKKIVGEFALVRGTAKEIVPNPNKSRFLVLRIYVEDAEIKIID